MSHSAIISLIHHRSELYSDVVVLLLDASVKHTVVLESLQVGS